jgi:transposase
VVTEHGYGVAEAARNLGLHAHLLQRWNRELAAREHKAVPGKGRRSPDPAEVHRLREENQRLRRERERFTKALGFVASASTCEMPLWCNTKIQGRFPCGVRWWG